jgi:hypothetical protein
MQEVRTVDALTERGSPLRHSQSSLPAIRVLLLQTAYNLDKL